MDDRTNPYAAPQTMTSASDVVIETQASSSRIKPAGQGARFVNLIVDSIAQKVIEFGIGIVLGLVGGQTAVRILNQGWGVVLSLTLYVVYYVVFEATCSRTLGKMLTGTKVVNESGGVPSFGQVLGRTFARMIPFEPFSFFGTPTRGWHDSLPKTWVVKV